jgi:Phosphoesterase family
MFDTVTKHPLNYASIAEFFVDAAAGTLPAVSLVDCDMGAITGEIGGLIARYPVPTFGSISTVLDNTAQSEENPEDIQLGEQFVASVTQAVMAGPAWPRTLMIWLYDEHGGYYDHVAPPRAQAPDAVAPELAAGDAAGGYNLYGPRVPAVVISPFSKPHAVTNMVHDHTSVLATIEQQWTPPGAHLPRRQRGLTHRLPRYTEDGVPRAADPGGPRQPGTRPAQELPGAAGAPGAYAGLIGGVCRGEERPRRGLSDGGEVHCQARD